MYDVELIPKQSVLDDVVELWERTGRKSGAEKGAFYFEGVNSAYVENGVISIVKGDTTYHYAMSDFYRMKVKPA